MKLYHGSIVDIQNIDLEKSKPNKDFGKAFFQTKIWRNGINLLLLRHE